MGYRVYRFGYSVANADPWYTCFKPSKPPDLLDLPVVVVCPNSSSDLWVFWPLSCLSEVFGSVLSQNMVLCQNEVYRTVLPHEVGSTLQNGVFKFVLPQNGVSNVLIIACELSNSIKNIMNFLLNIGLGGVGHYFA